MTYIFYDTETTGLNPAFDQILQFAAIVTDDAFNVLEEVNLRCRLQPHVLPSPGAMLITKVGPKAIQAAPHSSYEMVSSIRSFIEKWSPAVLIGFNSIGYDEKMLRQAFYQNLHPTYLTNTNGNGRMDVMLLAHAVAEHRPDAIIIPLNDKGNPSFKLVHLVEANSLALDQAHDAQADTRATLALAKHLKDRAPEIWDALYACRSRKLVSEFLAREDIVLFTDRAFRKSTILAGFICVAPDNTATHAMFDLSYDPVAFLDIDIEQAQRLLKSNHRPIRILKASNLPIVQPYRDDREADVDIVTARERMARIKAHPSFAGTIAQTLAGQYADQEPSQHIEEQIYGGFPSRNDERLMEKFHQAPWPDRYGLAQGFEDARYREFAERIVYAERPDNLPAERRAALDEWCRARLIAEGDVPWLTIGKARAELESLRAKEGAVHPDLLNEIENHLSKRALKAGR
jgi:exodeoxyribonuclease-1